MSGNIVLSLEIGSAYAIQVALLQIPVLVGFSALWTHFGTPLTTPHDYFMSTSKHRLFREFNLVFPAWDFYSVLFGVFLCTLI